MALDEQHTRSDICRLQDLLDDTSTRSKNKKEKPYEQCITFQHLSDYPYVMWQSDLGLDWDKVKGLYDFCISIPAFIVDDTVFNQWSPMTFPAGAQYWADSDATNTLYAHVVLLSLSPQNLLNPLEGREQGNHGGRPEQFVYSTIVVFIHPSQTLTTIPEAVSFFQAQHDAIMQNSHSSGWCILCKLPTFETSRFFPMIPKMPYLALLVSMWTVNPSIQPMLLLDQAGCNVDCSFILLLHNMWQHDMEYAIMPLALWSSVSMPWDLHMEDFPKLWQNSVYIMWKQGFPGEDVGLAMTLVTTGLWSSISGRWCWTFLMRQSSSTWHWRLMTMRQTVMMTPPWQVMVKVRMIVQIQMTSTMTYSRQHSMWPTRLMILDSRAVPMNISRRRHCQALVPTGLVWCWVTHWVCQPEARHFWAVLLQWEGDWSELDEYVQHATGWFGSVGELMGGQALLKDHTSPSELAELCKLAEDQIEIACRFNTKFSNTAFTLLQKTQTAFLGMGGITKKFV